MFCFESIWTPIISIIERILDYQHYWKNPWLSALLKGSTLSALLKGSSIFSIIERIPIISVIESIPDYQQPQQNHTDTLLRTAAAYQAILWENTTMLNTCIASWLCALYRIWGCWVCTCCAHCSPLTAEQLAQHWVSDFAGEREGGLDSHRNDNDTCHPHSLIFLPTSALFILVCFPFKYSIYSFLIFLILLESSWLVHL